MPCSCDIPLSGMSGFEARIRPHAEAIVSEMKFTYSMGDPPYDLLEHVQTLIEHLYTGKCTEKS